MNQSSGTEWSHQEFAATVDAYLVMREKELMNEPYNKAEINRTLLAGPLKGRSKSSVEYRMQNISTVMESMGVSRVKGYMPAKNVGEVGSRTIRGLLEEKGFGSVSEQIDSVNETAAIQVENNHDSPAGAAVPRRIQSVVISFDRDQGVKSWVLRHSNGVCEGCGGRAPFVGIDGAPFLEVHHMKPLADGGSDRISNAVALCPNCHRRCHSSVDREAFSEQIYERVFRLARE